MAKLAAIATHFPDECRTNDYFVQHFPQEVERCSERTLQRLWAAGDAPETAFDRAMAKYAQDPFRGSVQRRVCAPEETTIDLQEGAVRALLTATGLRAQDIGLLISTALIPREPGIGNAVFLADRLGLTGNAWNMESACGGPANALQVAAALVDGGQYDRVLVAVGCDYTKRAEWEQSWSWFLGDGGGAFLVGRESGADLLAWHSTHTADTLGSWYYDLAERAGKSCVRMNMSPATGRIMRACAGPHLRRATQGVMDAARLTKGDVDTWVFHTPTAWFHEFAAHELHIDVARTTSTHTKFANCGPALLSANLHEAATSRLLRDGKYCITYSPGSASTAVAMLLRWSKEVVVA